MCESIVNQEEAVIDTIRHVENVPVEFVNADWALMKKIVGVLKLFHEVTVMLSAHDASISMAIPAVTMIIKDLEPVPREDHGVIGMKRALKDDMLQRFSDMESQEHYSVATLLDSRYKKYFYRDTDSLDEAKNVLTEKLIDRIREETGQDQVRSVLKYLLSKTPSSFLLSK